MADSLNLLYGNNVDYEQVGKVHPSYLSKKRKEGALFFLQDKNRKSPFSLYFTKEAGIVIPAYIRQKLYEKHGLEKSVCYVEICDNQLYWLLIDNDDDKDGDTVEEGGGRGRGKEDRANKEDVKEDKKRKKKR